MTKIERVVIPDFPATKTTAHGQFGAKELESLKLWIYVRKQRQHKQEARILLPRSVID